MGEVDVSARATGRTGRRRRLRRITAGLLAAGMLAALASCGGSESADEPTTAAATTPETASTAGGEARVDDDTSDDDTSTSGLAEVESADDDGDDGGSEDADSDGAGRAEGGDGMDGGLDEQPGSTQSAPTGDDSNPEQSGLDPQLASRLAGARVLCSFAGPAVPSSVLDAIREGRASGVLLFAANVPNREQALANAEAIQQAALESPLGAPAIVAVDQEGGIVKRIPGPPSSSAETMGTWSTDEIVAEARSTGELLLAWGANLDLAPVADVARPGGFIDEQGRSFGADVPTAADGVVAFTEGLRLAGVGSTLKHFPGLGSATLNTDDSVSIVETAPGELWTVDFVPFAAGINVDADAVMMSSAVYPAVDERPAVYSPVWVQDVLRGELGFAGVVMSDALDTPALAASGGVGARAIEAAQAGVDLFIASSPQACGEIHLVLTDALRSGVLAEDDARASLQRVEALRRGLG